MQLFKKLLNILGQAERSRARVDNPFLVPLEFESLKRELNIVEQARRHGEQGYPPVEATRLTAIEEQIRTTLESERHKVLAWAEARIALVQTRLTALDIVGTVKRCGEFDQAFERAAQDLLNNYAVRLQRLEYRAREREAELCALRAQNHAGYGKQQKRRNEALDVYQDEIADVRNELMALKHEFLEQLESDVLACNEQLVRYQSVLDEKRNLKPRLASGLNKAEMVMAGLVQCYRAENQLHRNGRRVPAYFSDSIVLQSLALPDSNTAEDEVNLALQQQALTQLIEQLEPIRGRIQSSFFQKYNQLMPLSWLPEYPPAMENRIAAEPV